jgi:hypothetical protein
VRTSASRASPRVSDPSIVGKPWGRIIKQTLEANGRVLLSAFRALPRIPARCGWVQIRVEHGDRAVADHEGAIGGV